MGNRACVVFVRHHTLNGEGDICAWSPLVYLHWNGGPESIYAFLAELHRRKVRGDPSYACARFVQIVGDFFDSDGALTRLSLGVDSLPDCTPQTLKRLDPGDNGIYLVERGATTDPLGIARMRRILRGVEKPADWVAHERCKAEVDPYASGIAEAFHTLTQGKPVSAYG